MNDSGVCVLTFCHFIVFVYIVATRIIASRPLGPRLNRVYVLFLLAYFPPFLMRRTAFVRSTFHSYILENGRNDHLRLSKAHYQNPSVYYNYYAII